MEISDQLWKSSFLMFCCSGEVLEVSSTYPKRKERQQRLLEAKRTSTTVFESRIVVGLWTYGRSHLYCSAVPAATEPPCFFTVSKQTLIDYWLSLSHPQTVFCCWETPLRSWKPYRELQEVKRVEKLQKWGFPKLYPDFHILWVFCLHRVGFKWPEPYP